MTKPGRKEKRVVEVTRTRHPDNLSKHRRINKGRQRNQSGASGSRISHVQLQELVGRAIPVKGDRDKIIAHLKRSQLT